MKDLTLKDHIPEEFEFRTKYNLPEDRCLLPEATKKEEGKSHSAPKVPPLYPILALVKKVLQLRSKECLEKGVIGERDAIKMVIAAFEEIKHICLTVKIGSYMNSIHAIKYKEKI